MNECVVGVPIFGLGPLHAKTVQQEPHVATSTLSWEPLRAHHLWTLEKLSKSRMVSGYL